MVMNLLKKYGVTEDEIPETAYVNKPVPDPGVYDFTVSDAKVQESKDGSKTWIIFTYDFGDDGEFAEFFQIEGSDLDEDAIKVKLSWLRKRLAFFDQTLDAIDFEQIIGSTGTLELVKKGSYTNIGRNFNVDTVGGEDEESADEGEPEEPMALAKPAAKATASKAKKANPFG